MTLPAKNRFDPSFALTDRDGKATQLGRDYLAKLDALVAALAVGNLPAGLVNAVNDAAAAAGGVSVGCMYRNGSILMVRVV